MTSVTTDKEAKAQLEWDRILAEQANSPEQFATIMPETYMHVGENLGPVTEESPAPSRVTSLRFKGYVEVWDTVTGDRSLQPWWLLWQTMKKKRSDGSLVFTRTDPKIPPKYGGDLVCPLNPVSPDWKRIQGMGFKTCAKQHIPHQDALMRHVQKSHSRAWEAMERERTERIREEDRQLQREMLAAMTQAAVRGVAVPSQMPKGDYPLAEEAAVLQEFSGPGVTLAGVIVACSGCGRQFVGKSDKRAENSLRLHQRHCKGEVNAS